MKYVVSSQEKPQNFPIYSIHSDMDSFILFNVDICSPTDDKPLALEQKICINEESVAQNLETVEIIDVTGIQGKLRETENSNLPTKKMITTPGTDHKQEILWYLEFDGSVNKLGVGAGVWIYKTQNDHAEGHAYRLNFRCTNNMAEYEALLLGLKLVKTLGATKVSILGDSDLIIQQMKGNFVTNDNRLRAYRGAAIEVLNTFSESQLTKILRKHNLHAHSLETFASTCKLPFEPNHNFTDEIKHRPAVPDNIKNWQVFENDTQINNFLTLKEEFSDMNIDTSTMDEQQQMSKNEQTILVEIAKQILHPTTFDDKNVQELKQMNFDEIAKAEAEVIKLKDNFLPTGLTPLEDIFDSNRKPKMQPLNAAIEDCNIGTTENPKMIKLSKSLPADQKPKYIDLFKEFQDVFAWSYEDLKSYDTSVIQHTIPLKPNQKPFKQKLRRINPVLLPLIEKEVKRMFEAGIIAPIRFSEWVSNLVPTRKKTGEIRLYIDLRNLNKVSLKDHYPLPKMDHILQRVVGSSRISLLDGFSSFNQILVHPNDQDKIAFTTPWGTFKYVKMPFGLKNAGATFQRAMDISLPG